jgi:hypothetical protein
MLVIQFSQHVAFTLLSFIFLGSLLQAFVVVKKLVSSRLGYYVVWVAVFQRKILLASSGCCLKMKVV